eukprot:353620-Chlamydomonas_euryale.AAC.6
MDMAVAGATAGRRLDQWSVLAHAVHSMLLNNGARGNVRAMEMLRQRAGIVLKMPQKHANPGAAGNTVPSLVGLMKIVPKSHLHAAGGGDNMLGVGKLGSVDWCVSGMWQRDQHVWAIPQARVGHTSNMCGPHPQKRWAVPRT